MARRAIKSINWTAITERITEADKNMLATFKAKHDQYLRRMMANPETVPKIDWAYYKKNIATPGLVDKFQKSYETLSIPYPTDKYTAQIEAEEKEQAAKVQELVATINTEIEENRRTIEKLHAMVPISQLTMEEACQQFPDFFNPEKPTAWPHTEEMIIDPNEPEPKDEDH